MGDLLENLAAEAKEIFEGLHSEIEHLDLSIVLIYPKAKKYVVAKDFEELNRKKNELIQNNPNIDLGPPFTFTYLGKTAIS